MSTRTRTTEERRHEIVRVARATGSVDVTALAAELGVAKETVRRDLRALEDHGLVRRTHGGAYPVESAGFETTLAFRATSHVPEKRRIASAAVELLGDAETVFVDEGFTPQLIAEALPRVRSGTLATVDHWTTKMLAGFVIDLAYIGANGISREHGLTTPDPAVSEVKAQAVRAARRTVFAGAHTKFGAVSFCRFAEVGALEAIVTSTLLPSAEAHRYSLLGPQIIRV